ncbi:unnamed protein product [Rotaria magnacalcarata]
MFQEQHPRDTSNFVPTFLKLKQIILLRHRNFVQLLNEFNTTLEMFTRDEPHYLRFTIVPHSDSNILWKALMRIACSKILRTDQSKSNEIILNLQQFLSVHESLCQQISTLQCSDTALYNSSPGDENSSFTTAKLSFNVPNDNECCICMDRKPNLVLPCTHRFCDECFQQWSSQTTATSSHTCPLCRVDVNSDSGFVLAETPKYDKKNLNQFHRIRIVLGNESCDLDSTISACVYAYFLHTTCSNQKEILHLSVMSNNASTFRLRTEVRWLLKEDYSNVICIDDINLNEIHNQRKLDIILVDHNYLNSNLNENVIEIIDHHPLKNGSIMLQDPSKIKIEYVGSCCTLIAEKLFSLNFKMTEEIAYLLTGPIVFDTVNFSSSAGKTTEKDRQIYAQLQTYRPQSDNDLELYDNIMKSSADVTGLSVQDLLRKDAKQLSGSNICLIMSSLPMNYTVEDFFGKLKTLNDINEFLSENENTDGVIITSVKVENTVTKRQLGFYFKKIEHTQLIYKYILSEEVNLDLQERSIPINQARIKLFDQKNVLASRKQILPLMEQFIKDLVKSDIS